MRGSSFVTDAEKVALAGDAVTGLIGILKYIEWENGLLCEAHKKS